MDIVSSPSFNGQIEPPALRDTISNFSEYQFLRYLQLTGCSSSTPKLDIEKDNSVSINDCREELESSIHHESSLDVEQLIFGPLASGSSVEPGVEISNGFSSDNVLNGPGALVSASDDHLKFQELYEQKAYSTHKLSYIDEGVFFRSVNQTYDLVSDKDEVILREGGGTITVDYNCGPERVGRNIINFKIQNLRNVESSATWSDKRDIKSIAQSLAFSSFERDKTIVINKDEQSVVFIRNYFSSAEGLLEKALIAFKSVHQRVVRGFINGREVK